jgi:hypothetical protein
MSSNRRRRLVASGGLVALVAAVALTLVPAAFNSSTTDGLSAYVVANTRGPLPANGVGVRHFVHVINSNDLGLGSTRQNLANAFVIDSVDLTTFRDGVQVGDPFMVNAPPTSTFFAARWPTTVTQPGGVYSVGKPAIIPGENTVAVFFGQPFDGPGTYVFKYTLHGTLNGSPVDLSANSPRITATG